MLEIVLEASSRISFLKMFSDNPCPAWQLFYKQQLSSGGHFVIISTYKMLFVFSSSSCVNQHDYLLLILGSGVDLINRSIGNQLLG